MINMKVLSIESTAHTFGIAVIEENKEKVKVLSNCKDVYKTEKGGMIPNKVAEHHVEVCDSVLRDALEKANT